MLEQFLHHIEVNKLFNRTDKILLTISGGLDSMAMLHLFRESGFNIGVAHCNFQLRGEESKGDELLVSSTCVEAGIPFHVKRFDTEQYARASGISIQMAARDLRYNFFDEIASANGYHYVATAHHLNDGIETVLLNLVRGTGIDGLTGIPIKQQNIVRPLLFATREMIMDYASVHRLQWREDSSNASDKYHRNLVRNQIMPLLKKINPGLEQNFQNTIERLKGSALLASLTLRDFETKVVRKEDERISINKKKLKDQSAPVVTLWEITKQYGFNFIQCKDVVEGEHQTGKIFYSQTHQLTIDRDDIIISTIRQKIEGDLIVEHGIELVIRGDQKLLFEMIGGSDFTLNKEVTVAQLDWNRITFPLTWRNWRAGDRFTPLGMASQKKLSDFFIDLKVALPDKEKVTVLESAGEIIWIIGYRISDHFKVTEDSQTVLCVTLHKA
jgi:tRNA(Ile)-lysidine synthase